MDTKSKSTTLQPISTSCDYPLALFSQMTGLDRWALRKARRNGLRVVKVGRRHFVRGADWDTYLEKTADSDSGSH